MQHPNTTVQSITTALAACGWHVESDSGTPTYTLATAAGTAALRQVSERANWRRFCLSGGALPTPTRSRVPYDDGAVSGPAKFVATKKGPPTCLVDVPEDVDSDTHVLSGPFTGGDQCGRFADWAKAVTALVNPDAVPSTREPCGPQEVVDHLARHGWSASAEDGRVKVQVPLVGAFFEVSVTQDNDAGTVIASELASLPKRSEIAHKAVVRLAHEVNIRVPLARLGLTSRDDRQIALAQVHWGRQAISHAWLVLAVQCVESAVTVTAREMQAVADPQLAGLVLAAPAAFTTVSQERGAQ